jgi:high affinity sulfate transporter 1
MDEPTGADRHDLDAAPPRSPPDETPPPRGWGRWAPGLWTIRHVRARWVLHDLIAGLALTAVLVPAGMACAVAAGLPASSGLYATVFPLVAYAIFGPSRVLVVGPDSALVALIGATSAIDGGAAPERVAMRAALLALLAGTISTVAGIARAGAVTDLLSKPVRVGYMNGIALTVILMELPSLFGFSVGQNGAILSTASFVRGVLAGETNPLALAIGAASLAAVLAARRISPRIPAVLACVVAATLLVVVLDLRGRLAVVGPLPRGLPSLRVPVSSLSEIGRLSIGAAGIALVSLADTTVLSRMVAARSGRRVNPNSELVGLGIANVASALFGGFPVSASSSRTPLAQAAGAKTQLTSIFAAIATAALLFAAPGIFSLLPTSALAAVLIAAVAAVFDFRAVATFRRVRRSDFYLSIFCFAAVTAVGVIPGIVIAVAASLLDVIRRAWHPYDAVLGRVGGVKGYHDVRRYPRARQVPGLLLFRWDAPLFFANADVFRRRLRHAVDEAVPRVRWAVVAAEPITDVDTTAAEMLAELDRELAQRGARLVFAELKDPVKDRLRRYGLVRAIGEPFFFPTLGVAVKAFVKRHDVEWQDWEDDPRPDEP